MLQRKLNDVTEKINLVKQKKCGYETNLYVY